MITIFNRKVLWLLKYTWYVRVTKTFHVYQLNITPQRPFALQVLSCLTTLYSYHLVTFLRCRAINKVGLSSPEIYFIVVDQRFIYISSSRSEYITLHPAFSLRQQRVKGICIFPLSLMMENRFVVSLEQCIFLGGRKFRVLYNHRTAHNQLWWRD